MISNLLDYRGNIQFFDEEKIPPKEDIMSILNTVHDKLPHVNFKWLYNLNVLGPEDSEEKKKIAVSSFCGDGPNSLKKEKWYRDRTRSLSDSDINHLYKVYDKWRKYQKEEKPDVIGEPQPDDPDIYSFNEQVRAPWVIAYRKIGNENIDQRRSYIQIGNHSMITALLALEKGYDVSFCSCFIFRKEFGYKIWKEGDPEIVLTLSIGWPDLPRRTQATNSKLAPQFGVGPGIKPDLESIIL